jgi:uncharacterized protein (TIGR00290 family)
VFASWSGGKDCCLSLYRAINGGLDVRYLANMISAEGLRSRSHGMRAAVIKLQAEALGIPIIQQPTEDDSYRERFIEMLTRFREEGLTGGVFGDIDFNEHRTWIEDVCLETGMTAYLPLWQEDQGALLNEFIEAGFKSVIVAVRKDMLGTEFLGRTIDHAFVKEIESLNRGITPCGEASEYHSLVVDGPIFRERVDITGSHIETRDKHHFLEITAAEVIHKK